MKNERPRIKVPLEPIDVIVDMLSLALLVMLIIYTALQIQDMPDTIPTHFNFEGEADGFGSKHTMWLLPAIGIAMFIGFNILNRYPHIHNYMVNITEENALKNYRFSTRILRFVMLFTKILFVYIQYSIVSAANGNHSPIGSWFVPVILIVSIVLPGFLIFYQYKMNKK